MITATALQTANTIMVLILLIISLLVTISLWVSEDITTMSKPKLLGTIGTSALTLILFYVFMLLMLR
ncbi:hypothetical protein M3_0121 [Lysinibacillus phage vB_LfM_LysYB1]|nr:hypothetical protein M3_0121 [Lysinibacillus phage vB_LfM_LysYB1]WAB25369.1 hypothetical protein M5_0191 [Lysinibacillus phage vB_LfM_LysYB2]